MFTKDITLVPGTTEWGALHWIMTYYDYVCCRRGLPAAIVFAKDPKVTSDFTRTLLKSSGISLGFTMSHHLAASGQSERTKHTVETTLLCTSADPINERAIADCEELLPEVEHMSNTSVDTITRFTLFELLHEMKPRTHAGLPSDPDLAAADEVVQGRLDARQQAADAVNLAQAKMAVYFDKDHTPPNITDLVWLKIAKKTRQGYQLPHHSALDIKKIGPFRIKPKIGKVALELDLRSHIKIHPIISYVHLESAKQAHLNKAPPLPPIVI